MNLFNVLETAIGLSLVFLMLSVLCSGINEWVAHRLGRRGRFLREGLLNLLADRWMYLRLIHHPLIASHYRDLPGRRRPPAYLPAANVAVALMDVLVKKAEQLNPAFAAGAGAPNDLSRIREAVFACKTYGYTVADAILPLLDHANGDSEAARKAISDWYDGAMDRVSGWYKRQARWCLFLIGLLMAVLLNVDSVAITRQLLGSDALRQALSETAVGVVESGELHGVAIFKDGKPVELGTDDIKMLAAAGIEWEAEGLPIGFSCLAPALEARPEAKLGEVAKGCWRAAMQERGGGQWLMKLVGWFITALAVSLGAPFWFDLLNRLVDLRGAGKRSATSKPDTTPG